MPLLRKIEIKNKLSLKFEPTGRVGVALLQIKILLAHEVEQFLVETNSLQMVVT